MTSVCLAVPLSLFQDGNAAHLWIFLNWALGLSDAGCRVHWVELLGRAAAGRDSREIDAAVERRRSQLAPFGLADDFVLLDADAAAQVRPAEATRLASADLLLNFVYDAPSAFVRRFRRSALVDIDPGLLQTWMVRDEVPVAQHDLHFTIGETVGTEHARFSAAGRRWIFTPPPIHLSSWGVTEPPASGCYTALTGWWDEWMEFEGEVFSNEKRTAFLEFLDLPQQAGADFELAIILDRKTLAEDVPRLAVGGWRVSDAKTACQSPASFCEFVRRSRGEFMRARPSSPRLRTTWVGDRTLCYLASGRPALVESTAPSRFDFGDEGVIRFTSLDEAVAGVRAIESNYDLHARRAREIAAEHFDAADVARALLERALG